MGSPQDRTVVIFEKSHTKVENKHCYVRYREIFYTGKKKTDSCTFYTIQYNYRIEAVRSVYKSGRCMRYVTVTLRMDLSKDLICSVINLSLG